MYVHFIKLLRTCDKRKRKEKSLSGCIFRETRLKSSHPARSTQD